MHCPSQTHSHLRFETTLLSTAMLGACLFLAALSPVQAAEEPNVSATVDSPTQLASAHKNLEWLVGSWVGTGLGGDVEEIWLPARGGQMMGIFRMVVDDQIRFSEIMSIGTFDGQVELRLKHFDDQLHGWETKDEVTTFPFKDAKPGHVSFRGLEFIEESKDTMRIELKMRSKDEVRTEIFKFRRAKL